MNDFREFQKMYNDYLYHGLDTGSSMKYGSKEYRKSGRRVYGSEVANMRPKDYIAKCVRRGMTNEEIIKQCETALDPGYNPTTDEKRFFIEVIKLVKNDMQHSYSNDFRDVHEDYLMHFGILGMKWGVRRYQNPDGTLTPAGKSRYDKLNAKAKDYTSKRDEIDKKGIKNMGIIDGIRSDYYDKKAQSTKKEAKKYGTETPEEKLKREESDRNFTKIVNDNGFEYNSTYRDYRKKVKVKTSNDKNRDIEFVVDDHDRVKDGKALKQTLDDFTKNFADHEKAIKNECKKDLLGQIKKYNMGKDDAEYFKKMADNIGKGYFEVRYVGPNYLSIDLDDGVDDIFLPNIEYDMNKKKIMYGVTLND